MARRTTARTPLSFVDIVMRAEAETIKAAYEARVQIDELLSQRDEAYRRIAELEAQVETVMGEPGVFIFPPPPYPIAGFSSSSKPAARKPPAPKKPAPQAAPAAEDAKPKNNESK
jgi:hypothetical protein